MADAPDLAHAMTLEPASAADFLRSKRLQISGNWTQWEPAAHARGFTVANVTKLDVLADIQAELARAQQDGLTFEQFKDRLIPQLTKKGWFAADGQAVRVPEPGAAPDPQTGELPTRKRLTARRLDTIFRVNAQSSYMAARYRELMADVDNRPWFEYVAVMDSKTRPAHRALHGRVFRYDDRAVQVFWPPCGWRCRCRMRARDDEDLRERGITPESTAGRIKTETVTLKDGTTRQIHRYDAPDGQVFRTDPGFGTNPGQLQAVDKLALAKAPLVLGQVKSEAQMRRILTAKARMDDLGQFVRTAREARASRGLNASVGALDEAAALKLADEGVAFDATEPIVLPDALVGGTKSARHAAAGDALALEDWANVPRVLAFGAAWWDSVNASLVYTAEAAAPRGDLRLVRLVVRADDSAGNRVQSAQLVTEQALRDLTTPPRRVVGSAQYQPVRQAIDETKAAGDEPATR